MCPVLPFLEHLSAQLSLLKMPRLPNEPMHDLSEHLTDVIFKHQNCSKQNKLFTNIRTAKSAGRQKACTNTRVYLIKIQ